MKYQEKSGANGIADDSIENTTKEHVGQCPADHYQPLTSFLGIKSRHCMPERPHLRPVLCTPLLGKMFPETQQACLAVTEDVIEDVIELYFGMEICVSPNVGAMIRPILETMGHP